MSPGIKKQYPYLADRRGVWRELVRFISKNCGRVDTVLEIGPGYCDFINQFPANSKICFEHNESMAEYAATDVDFRCGDAVTLNGVPDDSIDLVFASNVLEHLDKDQLQTIMPRIGQILKQTGRLILIQPNYHLCQKHYFDDETHQTIFSHDNIVAFLEQYNFTVSRLIPRFLPFSMKERLPKWPLLVRLYLALPFKPMAGQMFVMAARR
ncbi:MAG: class I SAM-dependent methyltransferase [Thermodesulfobacteriota bacterium]|nr:class I SAM-dependent methyltransferase [Thermodesulfobacteriota bacterium]